MLGESIKKLETDRTWRVRELSDLRSIHAQAQNDRERSVHSRAAVVLCYAHWEGYCSTAVHAYLDHLLYLDMPIDQLPGKLLVGSISSFFDSYRDKSDTTKTRVSLASEIILARTKTLSAVAFERKVVLPRSNLDFERLREIFDLMGIDPTPFEKHRIKLDKELVKRRHEIAHGQDVQLNHTEIDAHTRFCELLMQLVQDTFMACISKH